MKHVNTQHLTTTAQTITELRAAALQAHDTLAPILSDTQEPTSGDQEALSAYYELLSRLSEAYKTRAGRSA